MSEVPGRPESKNPVEKTPRDLLREREDKLRERLRNRIIEIGSKPEPEPNLTNPNFKAQLKEYHDKLEEIKANELKDREKSARLLTQRKQDPSSPEVDSATKISVGDMVDEILREFRT